MIALKVILEGLGLGVLLVLVCAFGIRNGAVGMVHLYDRNVQERCVKLGLITHEKIKRNKIIFKLVCIPGYIAYVLVCVYLINGASGLWTGFWQSLVILSLMNPIDLFLLYSWWIGPTTSWVIPGTEDLRPYISFRAKCGKWIFGTVGMAIISLALAAIMTIFVH